MTNFGVHLHDYQTNQTEADAFADLRAKGVTVARVDTHWGELQGGAINLPSVTNATTLLGMTDAAFSAYLFNRGFVDWSLYKHYESLKNGIGTTSQADIGVIFNFGNIPDGLDGNKPAWYTPPNANNMHSDYPTDTGSVGKALHDFIIYSYRKAQAEGLNGLDLIKNVVGWQIFNEVTNDYLTYGPYGPNGVSGKPYHEYFDILKQTISYVKLAYDALGIAQSDRPDVIGPALGGTFDSTGFWESLQAFEAVNGTLPIETLSFHPYGTTVRNWVPDNKLYGRVLAPTDDYLTWKAMAARSSTDDLTFGVAATDDYFRQNTEVGMERTLALLTQQGRSGFSIVFTEFGGSSYVGDPAGGYNNGRNEALIDVAFVDPFKYGNFGYGQTTISSNAALNLQTEAVMQVLGLVEDWSFVTDATVFEYTANPSAQVGGFQHGFGISDGNGVLKPAAMAYYAYVTGNAFTGTPEAQLATAGAWAGVNVHIDAVVGKGAVNSFVSSDTATAPRHQLVLMRDGNDYVDVKYGDDIVFAGSGNDTVYGGAGWDRLYGSAGNDLLYGGADADKMKGGTGNDTMTGGTGADHYSLAVFTGVSGNSGNDVITDFNIAEDVLAITGGYNFTTLLSLAVNQNGGVLLKIGDSGATVFLQNVTKAQLTAGNFFIEQADTTVNIGGTTSVNNILGTTQFLSGSTASDTFVIAASSTTYSWGATQDGQGTVVYKGTDFDILNHSPFQFDYIQFSDRTVSLVAEPESGSGGAGATLPVAADDTGISVATQSTVTVAVLANDSDPNGDALTVTQINGVALSADGWSSYITNVGLIQRNPDGTLTIHSLDAPVGAHSFTYTISDGAHTTTATVFFQITTSTITGTGGNDNPLNGTDSGETINGLAGNDLIYAKAGNDIVNGDDGNDTLYGGIGADSLNGGAGTDLASYLDATAGLTANLASASLNTGIAAGDTFTAIEDLQGSNYADALSGTAGVNKLYGQSGNDSLYGQDGDDILYGGAGADVMNGGLGLDRASYIDSTLTTGIWVELDDPSKNTGIAAGDSYVSVEDLEGSNYNDVMWGDAVANRLYSANGNDQVNGLDGNDALYGQAGNDTLNGQNGNDTLNGGAGADVLNGGLGTDLVSYSDATAAVSANLGNAAGNTGFAAGDSYIDIENLQGSAYNDTLIGTTTANVLYGYNGNDSLYGDAGNDTVYGQDGNDLVFGDAGNDWLEGGNGNDWNMGGTGSDIFVFRAGFGQEGVGDFDPLADTIRFYGLGVTTFAQLQPLMSTTAAGTLIDFGGGNSVMLHGVALASLAANDFFFG